MIKLPWIVGGLAVMLVSSALFARQGVVITQDGKRFEGDITERGTMVEIVFADPKNQPSGKSTAKVPIGAVNNIIYADQVAAQAKLQVAKLQPRDVPGRIIVAQWAMQQGAYETARDILEDSRKIDPNNHDVTTLLDTVNAHLHLPPANRSAPDMPATRPANAADAGPTSKPTSSEKAIREVTPEEINRIKQLEWDQKEPVKIRIDADARRKFLDGSGMKPAEFARLTPIDQAIQILNNGKKDLAAGIHIQNDPMSVTEYHKLQRVILNGCAAAGCHSGANAKGGNFFLFNADTPAAYYSNFLTLQTFTRKVDEVQRFMIDRQTPQGSLLLEYMLPPDVAQTPHPPVANYKGALKSKGDPRFQQVFAWLQNLPGILPPYDIDLSQEPKKDAEKKR